MRRLAVVCLACFATTASPGEDLAIINANLIDGTGAAARHTSINVRHGEIVSLGESAPGDARILDVQDAFVIPGLIDSHVHLQSVPGAVFRKDNAQTRRSLMHHHLRAYVANGVTTVLDAAIASSALREIRQHLANGGIGPRVMALGPTFHNPGGYMDGDLLSDYWGPRWRASATPADVDALYREYAGIADLVGVKVAVAFGFGGPIDVFDTHTPQMRNVIKQRAHSHGRPIYVHVSDDRGVDIALELDAHALTHLVLEMPSPEILQRTRDQGLYVITTLSVLDVLSTRHRPERLDTPRVRLTVPAIELETARDAEAWDAFLTTFVLAVSPFSPEWVASWFGDWYFSEERIAREMARLQGILMAHHEAGIPIVAGTDSGSWPHFVNLFHGPSTLREMELMVEAGMTTTEVLRSATLTPAEMMGIDDIVGSIEVGKQADLLVVRGNPLEDLSMLEELEWVIKGGEVRRPEQWMNQ